MSLPLLLSCLWVLAATVLAFLPMRYQIVPGLLLIAVAPVLIIWIGLDTNIWIALAGLVAVASMFRNPLRYFLRRAMGRTATEREGTEP